MHQMIVQFDDFIRNIARFIRRGIGAQPKMNETIQWRRIRFDFTTLYTRRNDFAAQRKENSKLRDGHDGLGHFHNTYDCILIDDATFDCRSVDDVRAIIVEYSIFIFWHRLHAIILHKINFENLEKQSLNGACDGDLRTSTFHM